MSLTLGGFNHGEAQPLKAENNGENLLHLVNAHIVTIELLHLRFVNIFIVLKLAIAIKRCMMVFDQLKREITPPNDTMATIIEPTGIEQRSPTSEVPQVTLQTEEYSYIHDQITQNLQRYVETADTLGIIKFREHEDLTDKINYICWMWAQNPDTYMLSVNLKSLLVIRTLEDTVVRTEEKGGRTFDMYLDDPYWVAVDQQVYTHFSEYVASETAQGIAPFEALTKETPSAICLMQDHLVARFHDRLNIVHYAAIPLEEIGRLAIED